MLFVLYTFTRFTTQPEFLVCDHKQPPPNKGAAYNNSLLLKPQSNTLHRGPWTVSQPRTGAPGNDLGSSGTGGQILLCLTFSPHFSSSLLHITSCLGSCMLTAAQITGPQTWRRPTLRGGGSTSGSVTGRSIGLSGEERRQTVTFFYPKFTTLCFHVDVNKRVYFYCEESSLCSQIPLQHKHMDPASIVSILTEAVQHVNNFHGFTGKQQRLAVNRMDLGRAGIFFQCSVAPCRNVLFQSPWRGRQRFLLLQDKA